VGKITLKNIKVYGYHGCLTEEGQIGSDYRVDLTVSSDLKLSAASDNLSDTVDYVHLNNIVKNEMSIRSKLLESVAERILNRILTDLENVTSAEVAVSKINPPIGGDVEMVTITMRKKRESRLK
jgi:dihydroneopterin aldolase